MNSLEIISDGIIGSKDALQKLATRRSVKALLLSDTHNYQNDVLKVIEEYSTQVDALLFSGDGVADLLYCLSVAYYDEPLRQKLPSIIAGVIGNSDNVKYSCSSYSKKPVGDSWASSPDVVVAFPETLVLRFCSHRIFLTHGHTFYVSDDVSEICEAGKNKYCNIIIHGHTHCQRYLKRNEQVIINPGSLMLPRNSSFAGFGLLTLDDTGAIDLEFKQYFRH